MDDLSSIDWSAKPAPAQQSKPIQPLLRPNPAQSILTPLSQSRPNSALSARGSAAASSPLKSISPANDSFSNLLPSAANKAQTNLTLQDRQRQLQQERQRQIQEQQGRHQQEAQLWDNLGGSTKGRSSGFSMGNGHAAQVPEEEDDILAAFNSKVQVDKSSHFPPPLSGPTSGRSTPAAPIVKNGNTGDFGNDFGDDDDPFGLGSMPVRQPAAVQQSSAVADDDILGDLGRPVTHRPLAERRPSPTTTETNAPARPSNGDQRLDRPTAELVDMGFSAENAKIALQETGGSVQAAVSFLLNQAHAEAQQKARSASNGRSGGPTEHSPAPSHDVLPPRMKANARSGSQRRPESSSSAGDKEVSQYASEVGTAFFKSANSLWKAGRKQVQKAVADFQQEGGDSSQPKWMRDASSDSRRSDEATIEQRHPAGPTTSQPGVTDEALLLDSGGRPQRQLKTTLRFTHEPQAPSPLRGRSPAQVLPERTTPGQRFPPHQVPPSQPAKVNREQVEQQAAQAYVSSARRRKPATSTQQKPPEAEVDLFSPQPARSSPMPVSSPSRPTVAARTPAPSKPKASPRKVPQVTPSSLEQSAQHRAKGTEAFKRGDYDAAHQAYTAAISPLPSTHPVMIVVLSNRALTAIKTGDPKMAISDADSALAIIGVSRGEGEVIDLGSEGSKDMKDFYGKALMRKAEALEAMEKWSDALQAWKDTIEAGAGGLTAVRGRDRCVKAANPALAATPKPASRQPTKPKAVPARPNAVTTGSADAVKKLREQNAAAEKLDDEKFALTDVVSARIEAWQGGKGDNLRALLSSLENVLWEGAGWKKVGMAELVLPNKVKVIYMKAIAKVHPDKIPQDATTEQRMVSGSVFATLNEAWDKFKTQNGL